MSTRPPSGVSTRAAALASRSAKSTVIGDSPTRPRTPSVPKYLFKSLPLQYCVHHADRIERRGHVMGAYDAGPHANRESCESEAPVEPLGHPPSEHPADEALARDAHEQRRAERGQVAEVLEKRQVVLMTLPETEPGIEHN